MFNTNALQFRNFCDLFKLLFTLLKIEINAHYVLPNT